MTTQSNLVTLTPAATAREADLTEVAVHLHPTDEVAVARVPLAPGLRLRTTEGVVRVGRLIPSGHKVALRPVAAGDAVHKYGQVIGFATTPIAPGDHVHSHNLGVGALTHDYAVGVDVRPVEYA
ncbi:MAG: UxaA family hydrolase, partial [Chloroflexi bacterium]|nr:UxaA family hydrolase [Chloroflexota bacterium]